MFTFNSAELKRLQYTSQFVICMYCAYILILNRIPSIYMRLCLLAVYIHASHGHSRCFNAPFPLLAHVSHRGSLAYKVHFYSNDSLRVCHHMWNRVRCDILSLYRCFMVVLWSCSSLGPCILQWSWCSTSPYLGLCDLLEYIYILLSFEWLSCLIIIVHLIVTIHIVVSSWSITFIICVVWFRMCLVYVREPPK